MTRRVSSPLSQLNRGQVKFFSEEGFGYIIEDSPGKKNKREVFFRQKHFAGPIERHLGKLELDLAKRLPYRLDFRPPERNEELVYLIMWTDKGPMAKYWGFAADWERANRRITGRLSPGSVIVRIKQSDPERGIVVPRHVWEGELDKYMAKLNHGFGAQIHPTAVIEQCRATGWTPVDHPSKWHPLCLAQGVS